MQGNTKINHQYLFSNNDIFIKQSLTRKNTNNILTNKNDINSKTLNISNSKKYYRMNEIYDINKNKNTNFERDDYYKLNNIQGKKKDKNYNNNINKIRLLIPNGSNNFNCKKFNDIQKIKNNDTNSQNNQKNNYNHSFYESKYILKNDSCRLNNLNEKNSNNNTNISYANKENINISNISAKINTNKNKSVFIIKQNSDIKKELIEYSSLLDPQKPLNLISKNYKNQFKKTENKSIHIDKTNHRIVKITKRNNKINKSPVNREAICQKLNLDQIFTINNQTIMDNQNKSEKLITIDHFNHYGLKNGDNTKENNFLINQRIKHNISEKKYTISSPKEGRKDTFSNIRNSLSKIYNKKENKKLKQSLKATIFNNSNRTNIDLLNKKNLSENDININPLKTIINRGFKKANTFDKIDNNTFQRLTNDDRRSENFNLKFNTINCEIPKMNIQRPKISSNILLTKDKNINCLEIKKSHNYRPILNSTIFNKSIIKEKDNISITSKNKESTEENKNITKNNYNKYSSFLSQNGKNYIREKSYLIETKKYELDTFKLIKDYQKNKSKNNLFNRYEKTYIHQNKDGKINFIKSCSSISVPGINEYGQKKINQDSFLIERNINGILNFNIFGVFDGHGTDGHYVSQFVNRFIINQLKKNSTIKRCSSSKEIYEQIKYNNFKFIENLFLEADEQIKKEKFDYTNSGTTCIIILQLNQKIICANAGDSRAILIYNKSINKTKDINTDKNKLLKNSKIFSLSYDFKPELPLEKKRIYECGGIVVKDLDENDKEEPYRVYIKGKAYPGLAMSRSIGDIDAKNIGVIPNPQIIEYNITEETKYMVVGSDGIWEFINNEKIMEIGNKYYINNDVNGFVQCLYKTSFELWRKKEFVVDDITAIAVFFK